MDRLILNGTDGFPLHTDTLAEAQNSWNVFNAFTYLAGNFAIIGGCEVIGSRVSDGFVSINGEIFLFKGGNLGANVIIEETITRREFKDKAMKPVYVTRVARFGSSTPDKTFKWVDFKRFENLIENTKTHADFEKRLKTLENKKSPVPIGLVAIWGKPANIPIPEGWQEVTDLRGRMPVGWDPNDINFNTIGESGGNAFIRLDKSQLPAVGVAYQDAYHFESYSTGLPIDGKITINRNGLYGSGSSDSDNKTLYYRNATTSNLGSGNYINIMNPHRIVRFIEFVGF